MLCQYLSTLRSAFAAVLLVLMPGAASAADILDIVPRDGVTLRLLIDAPADVRAVALLLPGGHGRVMIRDNGTYKGLKGNFLIRTRDLLVAKGIATAVMDAPSDRKDMPGLTQEYRSSPEHAEDIAKAVAALRARFKGAPVWLIGTSRGSTSAANAATHPGDTPADGVVLTSSFGTSTKKGGNVRDFDMSGLKMPVLVVHHKYDGCKFTPPRGAQGIFDDLAGASRKELLMLEGGDEISDPCQGKSHHGYLGIEGKAIDAIAAWITGN